ncbi:MAG TPA: lipid-binding SYLF domain-containing protein [Steroidobacteraceae bacterium]|nr:lipid-binding SYLF domain-containing protein [Steroidobacteraceae bacterium]
MPIRHPLLAVLAVAALTGSTAIHAQAREEGRLLIASEVLEELRSAPDQGIPDRLLERAYGIAVIPDLTKVAFFAGGRHGRGVLVVRDSKGRFSDPVFISMTGGSFGWQWGVQSTDIVLVFTTPKGVQGISGGKVTLGADASVAAGPVGRNASAATDANFKAEVYSYSRSRGVFAGLALDGTVISIDDDANEEFYKKPDVAASDIINGSVTTNDSSAHRFMAAVARSTGSQRTASAAPLPPASAAAAPAPAAAGAQTFPLSDPQPGQEPK